MSFGYEFHLYPEYEEMIQNGQYDSVEELCNGEGLNYDEVYCYSYSDDDD